MKTEEEDYVRRQIIAAGQRMARLAEINAPAVIILDQAEVLVRRAERLCALRGADVAAHRAWKATLDDEPKPEEPA